MSSFTIKVTTPDDLPVTEWELTRAILEAVEAGSSRHCVGRFFDGEHNVTTQHVRLGLTIDVSEAF